MKRIALICFAVIVCSLSAFAKHLKVLVVKTSPEMYCEKCEKKVKSSIKLVKGTKLIAADLKNKTVTITYDADKSSTEDYLSAFEKIGYKAKILSDKAAPKKSHAVDGVSSASAR